MGDDTHRTLFTELDKLIIGSRSSTACWCRRFSI